MFLEKEKENVRERKGRRCNKGYLFMNRFLNRLAIVVAETCTTFARACVVQFSAMTVARRLRGVAATRIFVDSLA